MTSKADLIIMSIDPGSSPGYAVYDGEGEVLDFGQITTKPKEAQSDRLMRIFYDLAKLLNDYRPNLVVLENILPLLPRTPSKEASFWLSASSTLVHILTAQQRIDLALVLPSEWKKAVTGKGNAVKTTVRQTVNETLKLQLKASEHNKADALAVGLWAFKTKLVEKLINKT